MYLAYLQFYVILWERTGGKSCSLRAPIVDAHCILVGAGENMVDAEEKSVLASNSGNMQERDQKMTDLWNIIGCLDYPRTISVPDSSSCVSRVQYEKLWEIALFSRGETESQHIGICTIQDFNLDARLWSCID